MLDRPAAGLALLIAAWLAPLAAVAEVEGDDSTPEGHSYHGEAFNEGPRQAGDRLTGRPRPPRPRCAPTTRRPPVEPDLGPTGRGEGKPGPESARPADDPIG